MKRLCSSYLALSVIYLALVVVVINGLPPGPTHGEVLQPRVSDIEPVVKPQADVPPEEVYRGYRGTDASRRLRPFDPKPLDILRKPGTIPADRGRAIVLRLDSISLMESERIVRRIPFNGRREVALQEIVEAVADPNWVTGDGNGTVLLLAALLQDTGTLLRIAAPEVSEVRLASLPGVFMGGTSSVATIEGVSVRSWLPDKATPDTSTIDDRPFILYEDGSRLDIIRSEISYLGNDRVTAYGLSWRQGGTTGTLIESDIHHNFFGAYTHEARDMVFRGNRVHHNTFYGLDPHDYSTGLVVEDNAVWANGSHGIIFSRGVVDSVVRRNYSHNNAGNGIMMDLGSDRNTVQANRVENNHKDGIVIQGSSDLLVTDNLVRNNRQGIRSTKASLRNSFAGNRLIENSTGVELYGGTLNATLVDNVVLGSTKAGMIIDAPGTAIRGGTIQGGDPGLDLRASPENKALLPRGEAGSVEDLNSQASAVVSGLALRGVERGVAVRRGAFVHGDALNIVAGRTAIVTEGDGIMELVASEVTAPRLIDGFGVDGLAPAQGAEQEPPSSSLPWALGSGSTFIIAAAVLQLIHRLRDRSLHDGTRTAVS